MAEIVKTNNPTWFETGGIGAVRQLTETTLSASDTFTYTPGKNLMLILLNPTGGSISPLITGDDATRIQIPGFGSRLTNAGYPAFAIASGAVKVIPLDTIRGYLRGTITITGGAGLIAYLVGLP